MASTEVRALAPRVCALQTSLVFYDGTSVRHWAHTDTGTQPRWRPVADGVAVVDLAVCDDLNGVQQQLFAAAADRTVRSWTWQPGETRWVPWPVLPLGQMGADAAPTSLACWSRGAGHQQLVVAGTDGSLTTRSRDGWGEWGDPALIGVVDGVGALDAVTRPDGAVELYAVTGRELQRQVQAPGSTSGDGWGAVETVAAWPVTVTGHACWSVGETDHHAVLLASGELQQRSRARGQQWGDWVGGRDPVPVGAVTSLTGSRLGTDHQLLAAASADGSLVVRRWNTDHGWTSWRRVTPASADDPTQALAGSPADAPTQAVAGSAPDAPTQLVAGSAPDTLTQVLAGSAAEAPTQVLAGAHPIGPPPAVPDEAGAATGDVPPQSGGAPDPPTTTPGAAPPAAAAAAEPVTRLISGRDLLPLQSGDPERIGPFKLQQRIGGGQQSTDKYLARDRRGYCFLKVLGPGATAEEVTAFTREVGIARRVTNRHRLSTYVDHRLEPTGGPSFLALSFVAGQDLREQRAGRELSEGALLDLATQLLQAVAELADCGVVHCDLKPANIIMRDAAVPVVVDYGSAVRAGTGTVLEAAFGTSGFAAPEFERARATNARTDIYSWGAVVLWAATGEQPAADAAARTLQLQQLPTALAPVVAAALSEDPADRPDVEQAIGRLGRTSPLPGPDVVVNRLPVDADTPSGLQARVRRRRRELVVRAAELGVWRYRAAVGIMAVSGIVLGFVVGVLLRQLLEVLL